MVLADPGGDVGEALLGLARAELLAVVREGRAAIVDEALADRWPVADPVPVRLDGRQKVTTSLLWRRASARTREPGLERV
jgi:hypothetical protein